MVAPTVHGVPNVEDSEIAVVDSDPDTDVGETSALASACRSTHETNLVSRQPLQSVISAG